MLMHSIHPGTSLVPTLVLSIRILAGKRTTSFSIFSRINLEARAYDEGRLELVLEGSWVLVSRAIINKGS